jgi:hypothetical protein
MNNQVETKVNKRAMSLGSARYVYKYVHASIGPGRTFDRQPNGFYLHATKPLSASRSGSTCEVRNRITWAVVADGKRPP